MYKRLFIFIMMATITVNSYALELNKEVCGGLGDVAEVTMKLRDGGLPYSETYQIIVMNDAGGFTPKKTLLKTMVSTAYLADQKSLSAEEFKDMWTRTCIESIQK